MLNSSRNDPTEKEEPETERSAETPKILRARPGPGEAGSALGTETGRQGPADCIHHARTVAASWGAAGRVGGGWGGRRGGGWQAICTAVRRGGVAACIA